MKSYEGECGVQFGHDTLATQLNNLKEFPSELSKYVTD